MRWAKRIHKFFHKLHPKEHKSCCINRKFLLFSVAIAHFEALLHLFEKCGFVFKILKNTEGFESSLQRIFLHNYSSKKSIYKLYMHKKGRPLTNGGYKGDRNYRNYRCYRYYRFNYFRKIKYQVITTYDYTSYFSKFKR